MHWLDPLPGAARCRAFSCPVPLPKPLHLRMRNREHDSRRGSARQRGYDHSWEKARVAHLEAQPLCVMCQAKGRINDGRYRLDGSLETNPRRRSPVVDHIKPHRGDMALFWDRSNWQTLCADHHDIVKQREEHGRPRRLVDADGWPIDPEG